MASLSEDYIKRNFGRIWPAHVALFCRYLIECRRHFRGDLDLLLLLAVIGDRTLAASKVPKDLTYDDFEKRDPLKVEPEPINYQSIADFTGMPRESVRRKVNEMITLGWVRRTDEGYLIATHKAADDLTALTQSGMNYLVNMSTLLHVDDNAPT